MNQINTKKKIGILIAVIALSTMIWFGKEGYRSAVTYEAITGQIARQMDAAGVAELKIKELASLFTLGLVKNDTKEKLLALESKRSIAKQDANLKAIYFAIAAATLLMLYFLLSVRGFTIVVALGALVSLINGLVTPIMLMIVHKNVEYLGDVILSFQSKGILGSISKLYAEHNITVAIVILLFSVIIPFLKTTSMLFVASFENSSFAARIVRFFRHLGKWSMLDVFVIAILLVYLTSNNNDISRAEPEIGLYFFLSYVILSMIASLSADKMLREKADNTDAGKNKNFA
jgi:hypothetical protein